jgi:hypothetical protein
MRYSQQIKILFLGAVLAGGASVRASAQACGEATCAPPQGTYVSHFSGPGCTGTESYYLPYDGYAYSCRTWDGGGQCGTIRRTATNRSYFYNGTCYDAWPSGNTLSDFVTVYRSSGTDGDQDGLPDSLELALAQQYFPILNLHCGTYEGLAYGDRRQLYGHTVPGYTNSSNGRIPFVAHAYRPSAGSPNCPEPFQCIELRYGIAWNWDLGDDIGGEAHNGDSEVYAILLARKDTDGAEWGASLDTALNDVNQWRLIKEFMSAHWGSSAESSSFRSQGNYGSLGYQRVWCAEGKHAMYPTQSACNSGGFFGADDCGDNRCDIVDEVFLKVQNVGELNAPLNQVIPYPAYARDVSPYGDYYVWGTATFGSATSYKDNLTAPLSWCPTKCY